MQRIEQATSVKLVVATALAVLTLTSCGGGAKKAEPTPAPSRLVDVAATCGGAFRTEAATATKLLGASQVTPGPANYQSTVEHAATALGADVPGDGGATFSHRLCAVHPKGSTAWLSITFMWGQYNDAPATTQSSSGSSEYNGIGYQASSRDDDALIDFSCVIRSAKRGVYDGRGYYIKATADTEGLDALGQKAKREAQLRVLHAASFSVATALHCSTNLPTTLGALKPLPLDQ